MAKKKVKNPEHPNLEDEELEGAKSERHEMRKALHEAQQELVRRGDAEDDVRILSKLSHGLAGLDDGRVPSFLKKVKPKRKPGSGSYEINTLALISVLIDIWIAPNNPNKISIEEAARSASTLLKKECGVILKWSQLIDRRKKIRNNTYADGRAHQMYSTAKDVCWSNPENAEHIIKLSLLQRK